MPVKIKFEGIDNWNRAVFKDINSKARFGCADPLFDYDYTEDMVLAEISEINLCYFGNSFGCEPMGTPANNITIIR